MRRSGMALLVIATVTAIACAHPHEDALPGQPTASATSHRPTSTTGGTPTASGDETAAVCQEALDRSSQVVDQIKAKIAAAQADPASATVALLTVRGTATQWKTDLQGYADRHTSSKVHDALENGISVIDDLLNTSPEQLASQ